MKDVVARAHRGAADRRFDGGGRAARGGARRLLRQERGGDVVKAPPDDAGEDYAPGRRPRHAAAHLVRRGSRLPQRVHGLDPHYQHAARDARPLGERRARGAVRSLRPADVRGLLPRDPHRADAHRDVGRLAHELGDQERRPLAAPAPPRAPLLRLRQRQPRQHPAPGPGLAPGRRHRGRQPSRAPSSRATRSSGSWCRWPWLARGSSPSRPCSPSARSASSGRARSPSGTSGSRSTSSSRATSSRSSSSRVSLARWVAASPFPYTLSLPVEAVLGRISRADALAQPRHPVGLRLRLPRPFALAMAARSRPLLGVRRLGPCLATFACSGVQLRMSLLLSMQYRLEFFLDALMSVFWTASAIVPLVVLFGARRTVVGLDLARGAARGRGLSRR